MNNHLENGTIMPHGLMSIDPEESSRAFNKTYASTSLRMGVIKKIYSVNDPGNISRLTTEYDVEVIEQDMNRGMAPATYKNCLAVDSMGSIADYLEKNYRVQTQTSNQFIPITKGQNGATVLVLCLDATMGKGVVLGGLTHPDRKTNLQSAAPMLEGEYNGVNIVVNNDGSTALTFKGATDNYGVPTDSSQGNTTLQIKTDGSFEFSHSSITISAARNGTLNITTTGPTNIIAQGTTTIDGSTIKLGQNAVESVIKGDTFAKIFDNHTHIGNLGVETSPPLQQAEPSLSNHVFTE